MNAVQNVYIRGLCLGEGIPKICVPVVGSDENQFQRNLSLAVSARPDLLEIRLDTLYPHPTAEQIENLSCLINESSEHTIPRLFTFRTQRDGGNGDPSPVYYRHLLSHLLELRIPDLLDVEISAGENGFSALAAEALSAHIPVLASWHSFEDTPSEETLLATFSRMEAWGADIAKIAVMPNSTSDVETLKNAARTAADTLSIPLIAISMGELGVSTRTGCHSFGGCLTFAAAGESSAPGQLSVSDVREAFKMRESR